MKSIKSFFVDHGFYISIFFVGLLLGSIFPSFMSLEVDAKINISDILSMAVTSIVGIYIGVTISGSQSSSRFEKEYLIKETQKISEFLDNQNTFTDTKTINVLEATRATKDLNIRIINVEMMIPLASHCGGANTDSIRKSFRQLRQSITSLPSLGGVITPTIQERQKIVENINQFKRDVFVLITTLNSYH